MRVKEFRPEEATDYGYEGDNSDPEDMSSGEDSELDHLLAEEGENER